MRKRQYFSIAGAAGLAVASIAAQPALAAALFICDSPACGAPDPFIVFAAGGFDGGFAVNGALVQAGLGDPAALPVNEGSAPVTIGGAGMFMFSGTWADHGATTATDQTILFINPRDPAENGTTAVSDVLRYIYSTDGSFGHLNGYVISDLEGGISLAAIAAAGITPTLAVVEGLSPYDFSNAFISAKFQSDVPEPASLGLLASALAGFAFIRRRKRS